MTETPTQERGFIFTWYHREEFQVIAILVGLIVFFASRSIWVIITLVGFVLIVILLLYLLRIVEGYLTKHRLFSSIIKKYNGLKSALHGRSVERSRIAMALLAAWVLGVLCLHRIHLAELHTDDRTPTDLYWILFLGWYCIICSVIALYLVWLWNAWSQNETKRLPIFDGLVASLFFYHGLSKKHRIVTFVAAFWLGGLPSYAALRLTPETPYAYWISCGLIFPLMGLVIGGAFYAMKQLKKNPPTES